MAASSRHRSLAPETLSWPLGCLAVYNQVARDFGGYAQAMTQCTDAMEAVHVEAGFGIRLFTDLMRGYYDLAVAPWTALASVMAEELKEGGPQELRAAARPIARWG